MTLEQFARHTSLSTKREIEKVRLLAFFRMECHREPESTIADIVRWFSDLNFASPNQSRLQRAIRDSPAFIRGSSEGRFRLHSREIEKLRGEFPNLAEKSEDIVSSDSILPSALYEGKPKFINSLARQINAAYEYNIFDGCAVLMRRLLEVLLILAYQKLSIESAIQDSSGAYLMLERIITDAEKNRTLALSRNSRASLDDFRTVGNFSAHKIYYNATRTDLKKLILEYRAVIEELQYKAGLQI